MRQKRITVEQLLQILVQTDMKSTKEAIFQQKNPKIKSFVVKSLLESNCKRFRQSALREKFNLKAETQLKKTPFDNGANSTNHHNEIKEKL